MLEFLKKLFPTKVTQLWEEEPTIPTAPIAPVAPVDEPLIPIFPGMYQSDNEDESGYDSPEVSDEESEEEEPEAEVSEEEQEEEPEAEVSESEEDSDFDEPDELPLNSYQKKLAKLKVSPDFIPEDFKCAINYDIMESPVYDPNTPEVKWDRPAIEKALRIKKQNPFNRQPLKRSQLVDDDALSTEIAEWMDNINQIIKAHKKGQRQSPVTIVVPRSVPKPVEPTTPPRRAGLRPR